MAIIGTTFTDAQRRVRELADVKRKMEAAQAQVTSMEQERKKYTLCIEDAEFDAEAAGKLYDEYLRRCVRDGITDDIGVEIMTAGHEPVPEVNELSADAIADVEHEFLQTRGSRVSSIK